MKKILAEREVLEKVKELGPEQAELYKKMKKKSAFDVIKTYKDDESDPCSEDENNEGGIVK